MHADDKFYLRSDLHHEKVPMIPDGNVTYGTICKARNHWFSDQHRE